jgi:hypothetical protein
MLTSEGVELTLTDVKYLPEGNFRIISPGALISKGARAVFYNGGVEISVGKKCIIQGQQFGNLYYAFATPQLNLSVDWGVINA